MTRLKAYGPPGCGKTTWLNSLVQVAVRNHGTSVLVASLTKAAAAELRGRESTLPPDRIGTLHSHCYRALGGSEMAQNHIADWNESHPPEMLMTPQKGRARSVTGEDDSADDGDSFGGDAPGDLLLQSYELARQRMLPRGAWSNQLQGFAAKWEAWKSDIDAMDFTDLIERAYHECDTPAGAPRAAIFDEVQDFSRLELALVNRWGPSFDSLALAGDPDQAIYTWRGADPEAFIDFAADHERVLSQSYRIPASVHRLSQRWVSRLSRRADQPFLPRDAAGSVRVRPWSYTSGVEYLLEDAERHCADGKSVMIVASCRYQLLPLIAEARHRGIPFANPYRLQDRQWNPLTTTRGTSASTRLLTYLRPDPAVWGADHRIWTGKELETWTKPLSAGVFGSRKAVAALDEETPVMLDWLSEHVNPDRRGLLDDLSPDSYARAILPSQYDPFMFPLAVAEHRGAAALHEKPRLWIGTIHSFKGGEADVVYVIPDLSPRGWESLQTDPDSVTRLFYVSITRCREELILLNPSPRSGQRYVAPLLRMAQQEIAA